jgi:hypothetical protein
MAEAQLIARGRTDRDPQYYGSARTYGRRARMYQLTARIRQCGELFGPFRIFTAWQNTSPKGRKLVTYLKVGTAWYRYDVDPGAYTRDFYENICKNPGWYRDPMGTGKPKHWFCGIIKNRPELDKQAKILRGLAIDHWCGTMEQAEAAVKDPYGKKTPPTHPGAGKGAADAPAGIPPWAIPAALGAGLLGFVYWRRKS